ncbi:MAG: thiamine biosynthesis protein ThiS [Gammaproteobacteria bacterium RIFCSPHIGHO2_12_FULL_63_22]|nr:MAG: thiamine biosynthesis protein ThiS [Gammaproteobacteria bacterium RIFCSPHIGHO2_12_FULL_63_22]
MELHVNGQTRQFEPPMTLLALLREAGLNERRIAVEVNQEVIPRSRHADHVLSDGDRIEIIQAIGGG